MRRLAAPLLLAALLGCDDRAPEEVHRPAPQSFAPRPASAAPLPQPGEVQASRRGERYTVLASEVTPLDALAELSGLAGFRVELGAGTPPAAPLRLELREVSLEQALSAILRGVTRHVHYEFADGDLSPERPFGGRPVVLTRVAIGAPQPGAGADRDAIGAPQPGAGADETPAARAPGKRASPAEPGEAQAPDADGERARLRTEADERERERAAAVERDWRDPRAGVRLDVIEQMEPGGEDDRMRLATLLRDDPSSEVRSAAAGRLSEGNPFAVADSLLAALEDVDPGVVASAVRGLEDVYAEAPDPRIRERVTALREHRDAGVREAVTSFEEWLEE